MCLQVWTGAVSCATTCGGLSGMCLSTSGLPHKFLSAQGVVRGGTGQPSEFPSERQRHYRIWPWQVSCTVRRAARRRLTTGSLSTINEPARGDLLPINVPKRYTEGPGKFSSPCLFLPQKQRRDGPCTRVLLFQLQTRASRRACNFTCFLSRVKPRLVDMATPPLHTPTHHAPKRVVGFVISRASEFRK